MVVATGVPVPQDTVMVTTRCPLPNFACAVAPGLDATWLMTQLRQRLDPVFLPRPLLLVEQLPRNGTGKLAQAALRALAAPQPKMTRVK